MSPGASLGFNTPRRLRARGQSDDLSGLPLDGLSFSEQSMPAAP